MYIKYAQGNKIGYDMQKWLVDEENEISTIPKSQMGSIVYVISTGESWMIDSNGMQHIMSSNSDKTPIECDCVEELTIWGDIPTQN